MSSIGFIVGNKYRLVQNRKLGSGSFGDIYLGLNVFNGEELAIKIESLRSRHPQLEYESRVYKCLAGAPGFPRIFWSGIEGSYYCLAIELLGPSLEALFNFCGRRFTLKTVLMLADQLITRVEYMHSKFFLHRDIKPDNFLMGTGKHSNQVHIIDFGLSKRYRDPKTGLHIPYRENKSLTGTARYASINTHLGAEQSRRDDLESLGYVLIYFLRQLPWQGLKANTKKQKYERIMEIKMITPEKLCMGLPKEFCCYLNYIRSLRFDDKPDYNYIRKLFQDLYIREGYPHDNIFDWTVVRMEKDRLIPRPIGISSPCPDSMLVNGQHTEGSISQRAVASHSHGMSTKNPLPPTILTPYQSTENLLPQSPQPRQYAPQPLPINIVGNIKPAPKLQPSPVEVAAMDGDTRYVASDQIFLSYAEPQNAMKSHLFRR
ncbi:uncharacterized protein VTP21DRAFT_2833 [Calcarisporiella thermophila]|uniref:uncharacterized protein n=1 Tax=Calcarisporiella thermophila TaxID=911321 RepID=UPI003743819B